MCVCVRENEREKERERERVLGNCLHSSVIFLHICVSYTLLFLSRQSTCSLTCLVLLADRKLKMQSKVKELTREARNKEEELEDFRHKVDSLKTDKKKAEKNMTEVCEL